MPLVKTGDKRRHQHRDAGPAHRPQRISLCRESFAPGAKRQDTENAVADYVPTFADEKVPVFEALPIHAEEAMQERIENPAGIVGRQHGGGFNSDYNEPEDCGDPRLDKIAAMRVQAGGPPPGRTGPDSRGRLSPHKPNLDDAALLDGIVGSLAGDHDVVYVTLAEPGTADAHEARFVQELGDGGAAAVAHA